MATVLPPDHGNLITPILNGMPPLTSLGDFMGLTHQLASVLMLGILDKITFPPSSSKPHR
jgi:hypothetical protein